MPCTAWSVEHLARGRGRDVGVAVAVAADPGAEAQRPHVGRQLDAERRQPVAQLLEDVGQGAGRQPLEVVDDVARLVGRLGRLDPDLVGEPEQLDRLLEPARPARAVGLLQQRGDPAQLVDRRAAGDLGVACSSRSPCARSSPPTRPRSPGARPSTSCAASPTLLEEPDSPRRTRRLEEAVELLWHTDEIRLEQPEPTDEARNVVYYLDGLSAGAAARRPRGARDRLVPLGVELPPDARPLRFGSWVGGDRDGNPNVTPAATRQVLALQAVHGIRLLRTLVDRLRRELSVSDHVSSVSRRDLPPASARSCRACPRSSRATGGSTPRSRTGCSSPASTSAWGSPTQRIVDGGRHVPGRDYADDPELLDDLLLLHGSRAHAPGPGRRLWRGRAARPHRRRHRPAPWRRSTCASTPPSTTRRVGPAARPRRRARYAVRRPGPRTAASRCSARSSRAAPARAQPARRSTTTRTVTAETFRAIRWALDSPRATGRRELHHLDDPRRRRRARRRRAGPRGRAGRPAGRRRADRLRPAARDRRGARAGRARSSTRCSSTPSYRELLAAPRRRAGGDARLLRLQQGRRHHHVAVADPPRAAAGPRRRRARTAYGCASSTAAAARSAAAAARRTTRSWRCPSAPSTAR